MRNFGISNIVPLLEIYSNKFSIISRQISKISASRLIDPAILKTLQGISMPNESVINNIRQQVDTITNTINIDKIQNEFEKSIERYNLENKYADRERQYISILSKFGWPPVWEMPITEIRTIIDKYEELDSESFKQYIDEWHLRFCTDEIFENMIKKWSSIDVVEKRIHILKDVIKAHKNKNYTLSIPSILPQIEGTLYEYNNKRFNIGKKSIELYIDTLLQDRDEYLPVKGMIVDKLYEHFKWGSDTDKILSRHAILHGSNVKYNTQINSLKIILIYDLIVELIIVSEM